MKLSKAVSPGSDISKFVKGENPTPNNYQHNLHSFVPVLKHHQQTPSVSAVSEMCLFASFYNGVIENAQFNE